MRLTMDQVRARRRYTVLLAGRSKTGKTQSLHTLHKYLVETKAPSSKLFIHDFDEGGCSSLLRYSDMEGWSDKDIVLFGYGPKGGERMQPTSKPTRTRDELEEFMSEVNKYHEAVDQKTGMWKNPAEAPGAIIIDSGSALQDHVVDFVLSMQGKEFGQEGKSGPSFNDHYFIKRKMWDAIDTLKALPCHFVFIAHTTKQVETVSGSGLEKPLSTNRIVEALMLWGTLRTDIKRAFDCVIYTEAVNKGGSTKYLWRVQPTANMEDEVESVGTRLAENLPALVDPDFRIIFGAMKESNPANAQN